MCISKVRCERSEVWIEKKVSEARYYKILEARPLHCIGYAKWIEVKVEVTPIYVEKMLSVRIPSPLTDVRG